MGRDTGLGAESAIARRWGMWQDIRKRSRTSDGALDFVSVSRKGREMVSSGFTKKLEYMVRPQ